MTQNTWQLKKSLLRTGASAVAVLMFAAACCAQDKAPAAPQNTASAVSAVTEAAVRNGVLTCAKRIDQVVRFLSGSAQNGVYLFIPPRLPDQNVFSVSLEINPQGSGTVYASASFFPDKDGGCSASYDTVEYSSRTCADLQAAIAPQAKTPPVLRKDITIVNAGAVKVFFMPVASGCAVIRKEVVS